MRRDARDGPISTPGWPTVIVLVIVCAVGAWLRMTGLGYGLPSVYNPDEVAIMNRALAFATGDLNPHNFLYPTLYFYVLFAWEGLFFVVGRLAGWYSSAAEFERSFFVDPTAVFLAGRALTALAGTATLWGLYRLGRRLYGPVAGLAAAACLAAAPIAVRDAHYVKHDVPVTLLIVLAHLAYARLDLDLAWRARRIGWILAGVLTGLAMSTHYYAVFLVLPLVWVAIGPRRHEGRSALGGLIAAGLATGVAFVAASPFLLVEPATVIRDVVANRQIVMDRAVAPGGLFPSLSRYLELLTFDALGWPVFAAALAGLGLAVAAEWRRALLVVLFPLAFLAFISNTVPASRYLNPILPFLALAAGYGVMRAAQFVPGRAGLVATALTVVLILPGVLASVHAGRFFRQADTRTLARDFIERTVPAGASMLVQPYSVALRQSREGLVEALRVHLGSEREASTKFQRQLALAPYPQPAYRTIFLGDGGLDVDKIYVSPSVLTGAAPLAPLRALAVEYVVLKGYNVESSLAALRAALDREGRLVATFTPYAAANSVATPDIAEPFLHNTDARIDPRLERPGPVIQMWQIDR